LNIEFWLAICAMVLVALLIVLPPLWRKHDVIEDDLDQRNIRIARDRFAELKANKDSGGINQTQYEEQVAELELALSDDLELSKIANKPQSQGRWLVYVLVALVPVISGTLYGKLGNYQAIGRVNEPESASSATPSPEAINKMVAGLAEKLKAEPENIEGWMMLGRSFKVLERYPDAVEAYGRAYQLAGDRADVMLPYAEVLALANNGNWKGKPYELITKTLAIQPESLTGLWFAAIANAQQGDKKTAVEFLQKLEPLLPEGSPDKQQIHDIIKNTETLAGTNSAAPDKSPAPVEKNDISVTVSVSLANQLQSEAKPDDTVFIYAQALSGPKMPLAIVRKKVKDLPLSVNLTDADSMLPNMKLSSFSEVKLLARISKSGNPMPQSGDLIGTIEQIHPAKRQEHKIVINDRIK
jgi:cytochrome c-type biogenesis protein CcmH